MDDLRFVEIDRHFARFLSRISGQAGRGLELAASLASASTRSGHVCLDLAAYAGKPLSLAGEGEGTFPPLDAWTEALRGWEAVGEPGEARPLVLDRSNRLYLQRYRRYEDRLAAFLTDSGAGRSRAALAEPPTDALDRYFPPPAPGEVDLQREAAAAASRHRVTFITGGPGTGKTSTVVRILALLVEQAGARPLDVALAAPTGKAASRLKGAIESARNRLDCPPEVRERIPSEARTLHSLLGARPGSSTFRHGPGNPLPHDVVVVDEASMIDLPLMSRLVSALSPEARLVMLGDRDQLASVDPGAVFGDICDSAGSPRLSAAVATLRKSWRFREDSGIGALSRLVNAGEGEEALRLIESGIHPDIAWREAPGGGEDLATAILHGYRPYLEAGTIGSAFEAFERFRVLCAWRSGPAGVEAVNRLAEKVLGHARLIHPRGLFYKGRPILVTRNDYRVKLFNGDVGILFPGSGGDRALYAHFPNDDGTFRAVPTAQLPPHETVFATTVHKSQGSEFDRVLLLLGDSPSSHLTRELLYTGITRARERIEMSGSRAVFRDAARRRVERSSGLRDALAG